jgi:hypothetical protein
MLTNAIEELYPFIFFVEYDGGRRLGIDGFLKEVMEHIQAGLIDDGNTKFKQQEIHFYRGTFPYVALVKMYRITREI